VPNQSIGGSRRKKGISCNGRTAFPGRVEVLKRAWCEHGKRGKDRVEGRGKMRNDDRIKVTEDARRESSG